MRVTGKEELLEQLSEVITGMTDIIVYPMADNPAKKNRGFCFVEFESHNLAAGALRKLQRVGHKLWRGDLMLDWADPIDEPDEVTMQKVRARSSRTPTTFVLLYITTLYYSIFANFYCILYCVVGCAVRRVGEDAVREQPAPGGHRRDHAAEVFHRRARQGRQAHEGLRVRRIRGARARAQSHRALQRYFATLHYFLFFPKRMYCENTIQVLLT